MTEAYMIQQYLKSSSPKKCRTSYRDTAASKEVMKLVKGKKS
jgi:hypothetical protein